jgi:hypothetical protein
MKCTLRHGFRGQWPVALAPLKWLLRRPGIPSAD